MAALLSPAFAARTVEKRRSGYSICCCMRKDCNWRGNSEDAKKISIWVKSQVYCCKPREYWFSATCDAEKYTDPIEGITSSYNSETCHAVETEKPTPAPTSASTTSFLASTPSPTTAGTVTTVPVASTQSVTATASAAPGATTVVTTTKEATTTKEDAELPVPTPAPTPTPVPTPDPVRDPNELVDITDVYRPDFATVKLGDDITYRCCCRTNDASTDVTCAVRDDKARKAILFKSGCGGLMGKGWHGWHDISDRSKYEKFPHADMCVVPFGELPDIFKTFAL